MNQLIDLFKKSSQNSESALPRASLSAKMREASKSVRSAQVALAHAKAEQEMDRKRLEKIHLTIKDLESRAREALIKKNQPLAREAAEAIALLEDEKCALAEAISSFDQNLIELTDTLHRAKSRLRALKRGERVVDVRAHIEKAHSFNTSNRASALVEAEEQLEEIQQQQERTRIAEDAYKELSTTEQPKLLIEKMGNAGYGSPLKSSADAVLERLQRSLPPLLEN